MRTLMVSRTFLPESRGGMETHTYQLARALISQGHDAGVLHLVFDREQEEYQISSKVWQGIRIFQIIRHRWLYWPNPYPFYDRELEVAFGQVLASYEPDLVHLHHLADFSASLPAFTRRLGIPTIHTLHDFWPMCFLTHLRTPAGELCPGPDEGLRCAECFWLDRKQEFEAGNIRARFQELGLLGSIRRAPRFLVDWTTSRILGPGLPTALVRGDMLALSIRNTYLRKALMSCNLLISPSRFLMDRFVEWGIPASHFRHVYNSVPSSLRDMDLSAREQREHVTFGFIGTLYPPKGVDVLLAAFRQLEPGRASLKIWGTAPHVGLDGYAREMQELGQNMPGVGFMGGFSPEELENVLQQFDVLVMPSIWYENNPIVILEALAARIPVVAGDIGGMAELVEHEVNGLRFRAGDAGDLASKLRMMLEPERLRRCREQIVPPWSHEEMASQVMDIYRQVLGHLD